MIVFANPNLEFQKYQVEVAVMLLEVVQSYFKLTASFLNVMTQLVFAFQIVCINLLN